MLRNVFLKTLRDRRRAVVGWGLGLLALALVTLIFFPTITDFPELDRMMAEMAPAAKALIGVVVDFASPVGYLNSQVFFVMAPLLFLIIAIGFGSGAIAGEEERGTLELLLSNPLPRWRVVAEKFAALVVYIGVLALIYWLTLVIGIKMVDMDISLWRVAEAMLSVALLGITFGALALAMGCVQGRRGLSIAVASVVGVASYLVNSMAPVVEAMEPFRQLSPFYYYIGADPLRHGLDLGHATTLVGLTVVLLIIALVTFERRDLVV